MIITLPPKSMLILSMVLLTACALAACSDSAPEASVEQSAASSKSAAIEEPEADDGDFRMTIQDFFNITGRGLVVTGRIQAGTVTVGQSLCLSKQTGGSTTVLVEGIEQFRKIIESASQGENVGLLLSGVNKEDLTRMDVLASEC